VAGGAFPVHEDNSGGDDGSIRSTAGGAGGSATAPEFIPGDPLSDPSCETFHAMSGIFEGYEREYCELSAQVTRKTGALSGLAAGALHTRGWVCRVSAQPQ
jgi:hypothetical protein